MHLAHRQAFNKLQIIFPARLRLASYAHHTIHPDKCIRHHTAYMLHPFCKKFARIAAVHYPQHLIRAGLQRYVKMWRKVSACGDKVDNLIAQQVRLARRNTHPKLALYLVYGLHQFVETLAR